MNKRIKRKVHKRIIKKIVNGHPLSGFDKRYHDVLRINVYNQARSRMAVVEKLNGLIDATDPSPQSDLTSYTQLEFLPLCKEHHKAPSKWQRVKSKVKGWFAK